MRSSSIYSTAVSKLPSRGVRRLGAWLVILLVSGTPVTVHAQTRSPDSAQEASREEILSRVVEHFQRKLRRELNLDRGQVEAIQEITTSMREERGALFHRRRELKQRLERFVDDGGSDREARQILAEIRALRAAEARIEAEEEARLLEVLSPAQVLRFQAMRDELNERIRRIHRNREGGNGSSDRRERVFEHPF